MIQIVIMALLMSIIKCQSKIINNLQLPTYTTNSSLYAIQFNNDGTEVFLFIKQTIAKIIRLKITDKNNILRMGEYIPNVTISSSTLCSIYIVKDYLIASTSNMTKPIVFNLSNYQKIGQFDRTIFINSFKYVIRMDIIIFSSKNVVYNSKMSSFPSPTSFALHGLHISSDMTVQISHNQVYMSVRGYLDNSYQLHIFNLTNLSCIKIFNYSCKINMHAWPTSQNDMVVIFSQCSQSAEVYIRNSSTKVWIQQNILQNYSNISFGFGFSHTRTNSFFMISSTSDQLLVLDWPSFRTYSIPFLSLSDKSAKVSGNNQVFGLFSTSESKVWLFMIINQKCPSYTYQDPTKKLLCEPCLPYYVSCTNSISCSQCLPNYTFANNSCQMCGNQTVYNSSTSLCDDIALLCPSNQFYSFSQTRCVPCQQNCAKCASTTVCQSCQSEYEKVNGTCKQCLIGSFYNSTSSLCQRCHLNCVSCTSNSECLLYIDKTVSDEGSQNLDQNIQNETINHETTEEDAHHFDHKRLQTVMQFTLNSKLFQTLNKIPANRILLSQMFSFFINIDHLWLYIYHNRQYSSTFKYFLKSVNQLQQQKWNLINKEYVFTYLHFPINLIEQKLNFKVNRTSQKFVKAENQSSSFFKNTLMFFLMNLPLVLIIFILLKVIFHLTFNSKFSSFLRQYSFKLFVVVMLLQGNLQSFTYFIVYDCNEWAGSNHIEKLINIFTLLFSWFFFLFVFGGQFLIYMSEGKNSKYFLREFKVTFQSICFATFHTGILNFCLGACHMLMQNQGKAQLMILSFIEVVYTVLMIISLRSKKVYVYKYSGWQFMVSSLLRISLILTFAINFTESEDTKILLNQIHLVIIVLYLSNWILSIFIGYGVLLWTSLRYLIGKIKSLMQQNRQSGVMLPEKNTDLTQRIQPSMQIYSIKQTNSDKINKDTYQKEKNRNFSNRKVSSNQKISASELNCMFKFIQNENKIFTLQTKQKKFKLSDLRSENIKAPKKITQKMDSLDYQLQTTFIMKNQENYNNSSKSRKAKKFLRLINSSKMNKNQSNLSKLKQKPNNFSKPKENPKLNE